MQIEEAIRDLIIAAVIDIFPEANEPGRIEYNFTQQKTDTPRIWFQKRTTNNQRTVNEGVAIKEISYDLDVVSLDISKSAEIAEAIKDLDSTQWNFGDFVFLGFFVEDDEHEAVLTEVSGDDRYEISRLDLLVLVTQTGA